VNFDLKAAIDDEADEEDLVLSAVDSNGLISIVDSAIDGVSVIE
jgi:hypothetical protein